MKEIWKDINTEYTNCSLNDWNSHKVYHIKENKYEISNTGKVRNKEHKWELSTKGGRVTLDVEDFKYYWRYGRCVFQVKRLMYNTFIRPLNDNERITLWVEERGNVLDNLLLCK